MIYRIFSIDGGGASEKSTTGRGTGWCLVEVSDTAEPVLLAYGQVEGGPDQFLSHVMDRKRHGDDSVYHYIRQATEFVVENYYQIVDQARPEGPCQIIGMMKMYCAINDKSLTLQMPGERTVVYHEDLKRIGWWPGSKGHADTAQAIRHVLVALMKRGHQPTMRLLYPDAG